MTDLSRAIKQIVKENSSGLKVVQVHCASVSPFRVQIGGVGSSVPAKNLADSYWEIGQIGYALIQPPLQPLCFKTGNIGTQIAVGGVILTAPAGGGIATKAVTFPVGRFTSPPRVTVTGHSTATTFRSARIAVNATTSGFTMVLHRDNDTATEIDWIAISVGELNV